MERRIRYTDEAEAGLNEIIDYILELFDVQTAIIFTDRFEAAIQAIVISPGIRHQVFVPRFKKHLYRAIIYERTHILYSVTESEILIESIRDNRTDWLGIK